MAAKAKKPPRQRKPRQQVIEGCEPPRIPVIDEAAEIYVNHRDDRCEILRLEIKAHDVLLGLLEEHRLDSYEFDNTIITKVSKTKVKVKRKKDRSAEFLNEHNGEE